MKRLSAVIFPPLVACLGSVVPLHAQDTPMIPNTPPRIDGKAVWLLEAAATKLQLAKTLRAVTQTAWYVHANDSVPYLKQLDTTWYRRPGSVFLSAKQSTPTTRQAFQIVYTPKECMRFRGNLEAMDGVAPTKPKKTSGAMAAVGSGLLAHLDSLGQGRTAFVGRCDPAVGFEEMTGGDVSWDPLLRPFEPRPTGRELEIGEWGIARVNDPLLRSVTYEGQERWNGDTYDVVQYVYGKAYTMPDDTVIYTTKEFIDPDFIVRRIVTSSTRGYHWDEQMISLTLDVSLQDRDFAWHSPESLPVHPLPAPVVVKSVMGQQFPSFTTPAHLMDGSQLTSVQLLGTKRYTVVWWWNTHCAACIAEMPHFEQLARELSNQDVQFLAVDLLVPDDTGELSRAQAYRHYNRLTMPVLMEAKPWSDFMANNELALVVLDSTGKVVYQPLVSEPINFEDLRGRLLHFLHT